MTMIVKMKMMMTMTMMMTTAAAAETVMRMVIKIGLNFAPANLLCRRDRRGLRCDASPARSSSSSHRSFRKGARERLEWGGRVAPFPQRSAAQRSAVRLGDGGSEVVLSLRIRVSAEKAPSVSHLSGHRSYFFSIENH
jgi:hypothetical protein